MLNVSFALTIILYAAFTIVLGGTPFSFSSFTCLFLVTYFLLRFSPARYYLQPDTVVNVIFISSYLMIGVGIGIFKNMPPNLGLGAVLYVIVVASSTLIPGLLLLACGMLKLLVGAMSKYRNRINPK